VQNAQIFYDKKNANKSRTCKGLISHLTNDKLFTKGMATLLREDTTTQSLADANCSSAVQ